MENGREKDFTCLGMNDEGDRLIIDGMMGKGHYSTYFSNTLKNEGDERRNKEEGKMSENKGFQLGTIGALTLSVVSSVSIVICNKALMSTLHFIFATTLTSWHLLVTYCSLHVALSMKFFEHKPIEFQTVIGFGILNGISIGLLNLSLGFNSVGFYQMTKLAIIPCTVLLETLFLSKTFSRSIKFSLAILLLGVGIATVTDLQLNMLGSILSLLAVVTTCVAQIVSFFTSLDLLQAMPVRRVNASSAYQWEIGFIVLSCLISISVNFSTFLVIGKTSPVTYQVLGHLKTCLVLAFGYSLLQDPFSWRNIFGIMVALVGMILYSYYCTQENQAKAEEASAQNQPEEAESDPFLQVENATTKLNDLPLSKGTFWEANKDLRA
ncbi:hypothetical protein DH2020_022439 [Rehmannia glutinosa]|uniref:Sugar phosphate transporter domain-containing protein n=1 Tax=Rehmannia glutinosa TaxID=99300 RepID=A0ABR0WH05_REHGL